jgi:hypothetical protein
MSLSGAAYPRRHHRWEQRRLASPPASRDGLNLVKDAAKTSSAGELFSLFYSTSHHFLQFYDFP